jgi:L-2,4-diaminobutyrate decarboxylase
VVFRFREARLNVAVPKALFASGRAVVGRTAVRGEACVKLTLCNPEITEADVTGLLEMIVACGREL